MNTLSYYNTIYNIIGNISPMAYYNTVYMLKCSHRHHISYVPIIILYIMLKVFIGDMT